MNAIDGMFNFVSGFLSKVAKWIPAFNPPWEKLTEKWSFIMEYVKQANVFLPVDDVLTIGGLIISFFGVLLVIWTIKFLKSFIPFFGG